MQRMVVVLPAPFGPEEAHDPPGSGTEARAIERHDGPVALREIDDFEHVVPRGRARGAAGRLRGYPDEEDPGLCSRPGSGAAGCERGYPAVSVPFMSGWTSQKNS